MAAIKLFKFLSTLELARQSILWEVISEFSPVSNALIHRQICTLLLTHRSPNGFIKDDCRFIQDVMALVSQSTIIR